MNIQSDQQLFLASMGIHVFSREPLFELLMRNDFYESNESIAQHQLAGKPRMGIGENTKVENAIIDKNARVGDHCLISPSGKPEQADHLLYFIRDGIVVIPKNAVVPHGTVI